MGAKLSKSRRYGLYSRCMDVARGKNDKRTYYVVKDSNKSYVDILRSDLRDYLQVTTGRNHYIRDVLVVDVDNCPNASPSEIIDNVADICIIIGLPLPSAYQVHRANNHIQLYWFLKEGVVVKKREGRGSDVKMKPTEFHRMYLNAIKLLRILMNGDSQFTGWHIKNVFYNSSDFKSYWSVGNGWVDTMPPKVLSYGFEDIYNNLTTVISRCSDSEIAELYDLGNLCRQYNDIGTFISDLKLRKRKKTELGKIADSRSSVNIEDDLLMCKSRNKFTRECAYTILREYNGEISYDKCREIAYARLDEYRKKLNKSEPYTDEEFERDFKSAYDNAVETYDPDLTYQPYTQQQLDNSIAQRKYKEFKNMLIMANFIHDNPIYVRNTAKFNRVIADVIGVTPQSVSNYKRKLGIEKTTCEVKRRNLKPLIDGFYDYYKYCCSLGMTYNNMSLDGKYKEYKYKDKENEMLKRIHDVFDNNAVEAFMKNNAIKNVSGIEQISSEWKEHI